MTPRSIIYLRLVDFPRNRIPCLLP